MNPRRQRGPRWKRLLKAAALALGTAIAAAAVYYIILNQNGRLGDSYLDIPYKTAEGGEPVKLDIYMPERQLTPRIPMLVFFHGGGWDSGSKQLKDGDWEVFHVFRELGFAVVSVEYRLTNAERKFPIPFADAADALRWLRAHGPEYGLNPHKLNVVGTSAGGQMALLEGLAGDRFKDDATLASVPLQINAIVSICGPTDLTDLSGYYSSADREEAAALLLGLFGAPYEELPEAYKLASPINHIHADAPPILLLHGQEDNIVPIQQADKFYAAAADAGARIEYVSVANADHKFRAPEGEEISPAMSVLLRKLTWFLLKHNWF